MKRILYGFTDTEVLQMDFSMLRKEILNKSCRLPEEIVGDLLIGKRDEKDKAIILCYSRMLAAMLDMDDVLIDTIKNVC